MDVNRVTLCGRIGNKKELRHTPNNHAVISFSIATGKLPRKEGSEKITTWHNIVAWNKNATLVNSLEKGTTIFIEGELSSRSYDKKDGTKAYVTEVIAEAIAYVPVDHQEAEKGSFGEFAESVPF